jgi:hypothetical protein
MSPKIVHMTKEDHVWVPIPGLAHFPQRLCECGAVKAAGGIQAGENTITVSPAANANRIDWSASSTTAALGQLGMSTTTGRLQVFDSATSANVAIPTSIDSMAFVTSTTLGANATTLTVSGFSSANARHRMLMFVGHILTSGSVASIDFQPNANTANSSACVHKNANGTITSAAHAAGQPRLITAAGQDSILNFTGTCSSTPTGGVRRVFEFHGSQGDAAGASRAYFTSMIMYENTATALTSAVLSTSVASGLLTGSVMYVYAIPATAIA